MMRYSHHPATRQLWVLAASAALLMAAMPAFAQTPTTSMSTTPGASLDSCVTCHSDPNFMVTDKQLYDYFQNWRSSIHGLADVSCVDCHGGNSRGQTLEAAHSRDLSDAVSFENVPDTCGQCHGEFLEAYQKSPHFEHLQRTASVAQGPNCVTCHGSINAQRPDVTSVRETCQRCHNPISENHPEIPLAAEALLNDLNAIRGYRRFVSRRADPETATEALEVMDGQLEQLATSWHTFELDTIRGATETLLSYSKAHRDLVLKKRTERPKPKDP